MCKAFKFSIQNSGFYHMPHWLSIYVGICNWLLFVSIACQLCIAYVYEHLLSAFVSIQYRCAFVSIACLCGFFLNCTMYMYSEAPMALPWLSHDILPVCTKLAWWGAVTPLLLDHRPTLPKTLDPKPGPYPKTKF